MMPDAEPCRSWTGLSAENERLRAAFKEIREISTKWGNSIPWEEGERIAEICEVVAMIPNTPDALWRRREAAAANDNTAEG